MCVAVHVFIFLFFNVLYAKRYSLCVKRYSVRAIGDPRYRPSAPVYFLHVNRSTRYVLHATCYMLHATVFALRAVTYMKLTSATVHMLKH